MKRFALTVAVLIPILDLVTSSATKDCDEIMVKSDEAKEIRGSAHKRMTLLFFPVVESFKGVTVKIIKKGGESSMKEVSVGDMCVNGSRWYRLDVKLSSKLTSYDCTLKVDNCPGTDCGSITDYGSSSLKSLIVVAKGASFWSTSNTRQKKQCSKTPPVYNTLGTISPAAAVATTPKNNTDSGGRSLLVWLTAVIGGTVVLAVLATMVYFATRSIQFFSLEQQHQQGSTAASPALLRRGDPALASMNSLYEPVSEVVDSGLGMQQQQQQQQQQQEYSATRSPIPAHRDSLHSSNNSLYEPFHVVIEPGDEVTWRLDNTQQGNAV